MRNRTDAKPAQQKTPPTTAENGFQKARGDSEKPWTDELFDRQHFYAVGTPDPHLQRRKDIMKAYPQIKELFGPNPFSALFIFALTTVQFFLASLASQAPWLVVLIGAYAVGTVIAASLYALIHEATHGLVFRRKPANRLIAILANAPIVMLSAETFRRYHQKHHTRMGDYEQDVGIPTRWEAEWVGRSSMRKALWLAFFSVFQAFRTSKFIKKAPFWDRWMVLNLLVQLTANLLVLWLLGPLALAYLGLSVFFAFGFHPMGARVIQEHFLLAKGQETNNYTGVGTVLECHFGYHTEHHDFPRIPWNRLPQVRRIAPSHYQALAGFSSRTKLIWSFLFKKEWHLFRHAVRGRVPAPKN